MRALIFSVLTAATFGINSAHAAETAGVADKFNQPGQLVVSGATNAFLGGGTGGPKFGFNLGTEVGSFLAPQFYAGLGLGFGLTYDSTTVLGVTTSTTSWGFSLLPEVGVGLDLAPNFTVLPKVGLAWGYSDGAPSPHSLSLRVDVPFVITLASHVAGTVGPVFNIGLKNANDFNAGARVGILAYF